MRKYNIILYLIGILVVACTAISQFTVEQKAEFEQAMAQLNTPEKVNEWLVKNFIFDRELYLKHMERPGPWLSKNYDLLRLPIEIYYGKKGICHEAANFAGYALHKAGYEIKIVNGRKNFPSKWYTGETFWNRSVCAFKRDGKWWVCGWLFLGSDRLVRNYIPGPFDNLKEVASYAVGGDLNLKDYTVDKTRKGF